MWQTQHQIPRFCCRECLEWCPVKWYLSSSEQPNAETILSPRQTRWLGMVATSTTLFVLQLFLPTTISDPEPKHKPLNNSAALFPQPNPGPSTSSLSTGCFGMGIDPKHLFRATSYRTQTWLNVLLEGSLVTTDIPCSIRSWGCPAGRGWAFPGSARSTLSSQPCAGDTELRWDVARSRAAKKGGMFGSFGKAVAGNVDLKLYSQSTWLQPSGKLSASFPLLSASISSFYPDFLGPMGSGGHLYWISSSYFA